LPATQRQRRLPGNGPTFCPRREGKITQEINRFYLSIHAHAVSVDGNRIIAGTAIRPGVKHGELAIQPPFARNGFYDSAVNAYLPEISAFHHGSQVRGMGTRCYFEVVRYRKACAFLEGIPADGLVLILYGGIPGITFLEPIVLKDGIRRKIGMEVPQQCIPDSYI